MTAMIFLDGVLLGMGIAFAIASYHVRRAKARQKPPTAWTSISGQPQPGTAAFTILSAMSGQGCLGRSQPEEPVFVLVARDPLAADVVLNWADDAEHAGVPALKVKDARRIATAMDAWRRQHGITEAWNRS